MRWWVVAVVPVLGVAGWSGLGRDRQRQVHGAVRKITQGVQDASATVQDKFAEAQTSARNVGLEQQIEARLHSEKTLDAEKIELHVEDESTAILKGLVPDAAAKEKAVALTRDTRGVLQVVDHLAVVPPPRIIVARPANETVPAVAGVSRLQR
jgi:osmotically-inducible protein OsmY